MGSSTRENFGSSPEPRELEKRPSEGTSARGTGGDRGGASGGRGGLGWSSSGEVGEKLETDKTYR